MRLIAPLFVIGCLAASGSLAMSGCRGRPADPPAEAGASISGERSPAGGGGSGDPRAGRKDRPQRPELEE